MDRKGAGEGAREETETESKRYTEHTHVYTEGPGVC